MVRFEVITDGVGVVGHAGAALLGELADRLGLATALDWHQVGGRRGHADAAVLGDLAVVLADGGDCLSDLAVLRDQPALFGTVAPRRPPGESSNGPARTLMGAAAAGHASPGAAGDLMELVDLALAQLPADQRPVLVRSASTRLAWHLRERGIGVTLGRQIDAHVREAIPAQPEPAWTPRSSLTGRPVLAPRSAS